MSKLTYSLLGALTLTCAVEAASIVTTEFSTDDGFVTGGTDDVTVGNLVTFSGGQQQQMFSPDAYNAGPAAYLFINGGGGFEGAASTGDTGQITFLGQGAISVTFHAANLAQGAATTFTSFDAFDNELETFTTQVTALNGDDPNEILTFTALEGVNIARIEVDLPGPAQNPPYAASIDTFSADIAVPEPSSSVLLGLAMGIPLLRRRR